MNWNEVRLGGNLTRDPELRFTPKGAAVCKFGLAVNRKWRDQGGELKEEVTFVDVDCFGKTAENISQYFKKGNRIFIAGRLKLDQWNDKQTNKPRSKLGIVCETFQFIDNKGTNAAPPARQADQPSAAPADAPPTDGAEAPPPAEDDVPF